MSGGLAVLDLFSGACGGWSLGMHRAGYRTIAACEVDPWRQRQYLHNFPGVRMYDDVTTLSAGQLRSDGLFPDIIVGSPPCQDASNANTSGRGIDGERTGLYLEFVRIALEIRPRWLAAENVPGIRNRGIDRVLRKLEEGGYTCWPLVVGASDLGAPHLRKRSWVIAGDAEAVKRLAAHTNGDWQPSIARDEQMGRRVLGERSSPDAVESGWPGERRSGQTRTAECDPQYAERPFAQPQSKQMGSAGQSWEAVPPIADELGLRIAELSERSIAQETTPQECLTAHATRNGRRQRREGRSHSGTEGQAEQALGADATNAEICCFGSGPNQSFAEPKVCPSCQPLGEGLAQQCCESGDDGTQFSSLERAIEARCGDIAQTWNGGITGRIGVDARLPKGLARPLLSAYGDTIVPQIAEMIGRIMRQASGP